MKTERRRKWWIKLIKLFFSPRKKSHNSLSWYTSVRIHDDVYQRGKKTTYIYIMGSYVGAEFEILSIKLIISRVARLQPLEKTSFFNMKLFTPRPPGGPIRPLEGRGRGRGVATRLLRDDGGNCISSANSHSALFSAIALFAAQIFSNKRLAWVRVFPRKSYF